MKDGTGTKWEQIEAYGYSKPSNTVSLMSNTGNAIPSKGKSNSLQQLFKKNDIPSTLTDDEIAVDLRIQKGFIGGGDNEGTPKTTGAYNPNLSMDIGNGLGKLNGKSINVSEKGLNLVKKTYIPVWRYSRKPSDDKQN